MVLYHSPKIFGNFAQNVNGEINLARPTGKFSKETESSPNIRRVENVLTFAIRRRHRVS